MKLRHNPVFSENSYLPYFGLVWLALCLVMEVTFMAAPASGVDTLAKGIALLVGAGFMYAGVWLVQQPVRFDICPAGDKLYIRRIRIFGPADEQEINLADVASITVDEVTDNEYATHYRILINTHRGTVEDPLPNLSEARAERARYILEGLCGRARPTKLSPTSPKQSPVLTKQLQQNTAALIQPNGLFAGLMLGVCCVALGISNLRPDESTVPPREPDPEAFAALAKITANEEAPCHGRRFCLIIAVAEWCSASRGSEPFISALRRYFDEGDVGVLIAVSDDELGAAEPYIRRFGPSGIVDQGGNLNRLLGDWRYPAWWVVENNLAVRAYWRGGFRYSGLSDEDAVDDFFSQYMKYPLHHER